jgi:uncharacterized glyoxalase superfamily protein PhnB
MPPVPEVAALMPYLGVDDASAATTSKRVRRQGARPHGRPGGSVMHAELEIGDSSCFPIRSRSEYEAPGSAGGLTS